MAEKKEKIIQKRNDRRKVHFIIVHEFAGQQTMQEAFEQQVYGHFEEWVEKKTG